MEDTAQPPHILVLKIRPIRPAVDAYRQSIFARLHVASDVEFGRHAAVLTDTDFLSIYPNMERRIDSIEVQKDLAITPFFGNHECAAVTLQVLRDDPPYDYLERISTRLAGGLSYAAAQACIPHTLARVGSMMTLFFNPDVVTDWDVASRSDRQRFAKYFWGLIERGVYMPCSQFEALFVSAGHTEDDIAATVQAAREVCATL